MAENFFGITDTGRQRQNNEDAFIAQKVLNDQYIMACAIDGVGGYEGGEVAAAIAKESILDYFRIPSGDVMTMMKEAMIVANQKILKEKGANRQYESMACVVTLALIDVRNRELFFAHVGDTRLYLLRDHSLIKLTKDHSFVGFLEDSGRLAEDAAMNHPKRNEINRALGFDGPIGINTDYIETGTSPFLPGDMALLCSDGLTDLVNQNEMTALLSSDRSLEEKCQLLVNAANEKGGKDNITVVVVHNNAKPIKQKATKPVVVKKNERLKIGTEENNASYTSGSKNEMKQQPAKKRNEAVLLLGALCLLLFAALLWSLFRGEEEEQVTPASNSTELQQSPSAQRLSGLLQVANLVTISDSVFSQPIIVTDTITINKDSLHLIGEGPIVLRGDSAYLGPAFVLGSNCKYVLLENIVLENFKIGIATETATLRLKNVQFKNCTIAVQHQLMLSDSLPVSGRLTDHKFIADTLIQTTLRK